jgi:hypothetical protein
LIHSASSNGEANHGQRSDEEQQGSPQAEEGRQEAPVPAAKIKDKK